MPRAAPLRQVFEARLPSLLVGKRDVQLDAFGLIGQLPERMAKGSPLRPKAKYQKDRYARLLANDDKEGITSWKTV